MHFDPAGGLSDELAEEIRRELEESGDDQTPDAAADDDDARGPAGDDEPG